MRAGPIDHASRPHGGAHVFTEALFSMFFEGLSKYPIRRY